MIQEGVIKFQLRFLEAPPLPLHDLREINAWRKLLFQTRLIGQQTDRYGGFGYGNISRLIPPYNAPAHHRQFIITGSQTGGIDNLTESHYCLVTESYSEQNLAVARGPIRPSSESLTHAVLYDADAEIRVVIHVHSPDIWRSAKRLGLEISREDTLYGTPEMAEEVKRLYQETAVKSHLIFAMGGHEDGIVSFGKTFEEAGFVILQYLTKAYQFTY